MASRQLFLILLAAQLAAAQTDLLGSIFSVAGSFITSVFAPATTTSSSSSSQTTSTSTTSSTSSATSTTPSPSQTAAAVSSPTASSASTGVAAQSSPTSVTSGNGGGNGSSNTLAIVLGCTLGALALAAFIALFFFCRRRRHRAKATPKHHALSHSDDEAETWHHEKPRVRSLKEPMAEVNAIDHTSPSTTFLHGQGASDYHHHQHHQGHQNPFVPVPPPARRSMHNGVHDDTGYSAHPFRPEDISSHGTGANPTQGHHSNHALAAGAGGAALGGLAAQAKHRHDRKRSTSRGRVEHLPKSDHKFSEDEHNILPEAASVTRRSGSVSRASAREPWPFMDAAGKRSSESTRPVSRGPSQSHDRYSTPNQYPHSGDHGASGTTVAGAVAAGGLAGAAMSGKAKSHSPHRKGILKQTVSDSSHTSSDPSSLTTEDYLPPTLSKSSPRPLSTSGPHELETPERPSSGRTGGHQHNLYDVPAPVTAALAANAAKKQHRRSGSGGSASLSPLVIPTEENPPIIPSRSPKRNSLEHSRARYSSAHEGTAELPSHNPMVSPSIDARKVTENDGLLSPVSPISASQSGSLKIPAANTSSSHPIPREKSSSQESTVVNTSSPDQVLHGDQQSSGLVSAIQKIFNSGNSAPEHHEALVGDEDVVDAHPNREKRLRDVPYRRPAPDRSSHQPISQYGDISGQYHTDTMPGAWENAPSRRSGDSGQSLPPRYRSRGNSFGNTVHDDGFTPVPTNETHHRSHSRPGYGIGSGDPFDLARTRTDSSMTGISLSNYHEPTANAGRPRSYRKSSGSDYREPTLAELRREVVAEDRHRAQQAWRGSHPHSRSNSSGLRYGDDRELFNLVDQTTGGGRYYTATPQEGRVSTGGHVGRAY